MRGAKAILKIVDNYIMNKDKFVLGWSTDNSLVPTVEFPFDLMRQTAQVVSNTLSNKPLTTLENHSLSEINTWADNDETISIRIADELVNNTEPSTESQGNETKVYPTHIISGAIYALMENVDISSITNNAISALNNITINTMYGADIHSSIMIFNCIDSSHHLPLEIIKIFKNI